VVITLALGGEAVWGDDDLGQVLAVVVDPGGRTVTHVVVEPKGRRGLARLVPLELVDLAGTAAGRVTLLCTEAEFQDLDPAEEELAEFTLGYEVPVQLLPPGWRDAGGPAVEGASIPRIPEKETIDIVPAGEVEERRGGHVHATDGDIGQLAAFRIDPDSRQVTHVLVREGRLVAHKDVAIPFDKVTGFEDGIRVSLTRQQVRDLPPDPA
jgi:sporulation protein YlmC with PRC-barrel domain